MKRRTVIAAAYSVIGGSLTGCLEFPETADSTRANPSSNENLTRTNTAEESTINSTDSDSQSFYVWNDGEQATCISIELNSIENEKLLINNNFKIEKNKIVEFPRILNIGKYYRVRCFFEDGRDITHEWKAERCSEYAGGDNFEKAGYIKYNSDQAFFATKSCDAVNMEMSQITTVHSSNVPNCKFEQK